MNDTPEMIRQQMEETRSNLSEKMESLEHQVSETVHSTGTAVNATVGAVQDTVETVTGAVRAAVQSVSHAFNVRRQISRHPWLVIGGSVALGYLAYGFLTSGGKKLALEPVSIPEPSAGNVDESGKPGVRTAAAPATIAAAYQSGREHAVSHRTRDMAIDALIGVAHAVAIHAVPRVMDYFTGHPPSGSGISHFEGPANDKTPHQTWLRTSAKKGNGHES